jgi:hypothetical protein
VHQANGLVERVNRTLAQKIRCMLIGANLNSSMWCLAVAQAVRIYNSTPHSALDMETPHSIFHNAHLNEDLSRFRTFGEAVTIPLASDQRKKNHKFDNRSKFGIRIGLQDDYDLCFIPATGTTELVRLQDKDFMNRFADADELRQFACDSEEEFLADIDGDWIEEENGERSDSNEEQTEEQTAEGIEIAMNPSHSSRRNQSST